MTKLKVRKVDGKWRVSHEFCVGIKDTVVNFQLWDSALHFANYHVWWHQQRGKKVDA